MFCERNEEWQSDEMIRVLAGAGRSTRSAAEVPLYQRHSHTPPANFVLSRGATAALMVHSCLRSSVKSECQRQNGETISSWRIQWHHITTMTQRSLRQKLTWRKRSRRSRMAEQMLTLQCPLSPGAMWTSPGSRSSKEKEPQNNGVQATRTSRAPDSARYYHSLSTHNSRFSNIASSSWL